MNIAWHATTAIPFIAGGYHWAALGCIIPDLFWVHNEIMYRLSKEKNWHDWVQRLEDVYVIPYRIAHSVVIVIPIGIFLGYIEFLIGWAVHIVLDLPTHRGRMAQIPFYPFGWTWPEFLTFKY